MAEHSECVGLEDDAETYQLEDPMQAYKDITELLLTTLTSATVIIGNTHHLQWTAMMVAYLKLLTLNIRKLETQ